MTVSPNARYLSYRPLNATVGLYSTTPNATEGMFAVEARTRHAPIHVGFVDAPPDSRLVLDAQTFSHEGTVTLHPAFEGSFVLARKGVDAAWRLPEVYVPEGVEDPAGRGRKRAERRTVEGSFGSCVGAARCGQETEYQHMLRSQKRTPP